MVNLLNYKRKKNCSLLGVGPMSLNCVDAVIEIANAKRVPIILIASRRQIDSEEFGGGYVNNWNTRSFARYVRNKDKGKYVYLARDHGGPWQNNKELESKLSADDALIAAEKSFLEDITSGFDLIHIDPSVDPHEPTSKETSMKRLMRLYEYCNEHALSEGKDIIYEIGTEEQSGSTNTPLELTETLVQVSDFCSSLKLGMPKFVVIQSGTKVLEMRNVGSFDSPVRIRGQLPIQLQVPMMVNICKKHDVMMKAHNCDYLSSDALCWHNRLGIDAVNIAPEYGVTETKELIDVLRNNNLEQLADDFLAISFNSKKWEKWMVPSSTASDEERAIISGHYVFSDAAVVEIINKATHDLAKNGIDLKHVLKSSVKNILLTHLENLKILNRHYD